jgi:hypothetical protein
VLPLVALALGCGLSMRYVVESDMRFEHCYRIDEDPSTKVEDKRKCWHDWTANYQNGQEGTRVAYATERLRVLDGSGASNEASPPTAPTGGSGAGPTPNSPYAPPPTLATVSVSASTNGEVSAVTGSSGFQACSDACNKDWKSCAPGCGGELACVTNCESRFRECMKGCF